MAHPKSIKIVQSCERCGAGFFAYIGNVRRGAARFCSRSCATNGVFGGQRSVLAAGARFWAKVGVGSPSECWPWLAGRDQLGYGRIGVNGVVRRAHRVAWELTNGPIPDGLLACHSCDNPRCCNPAHLWLGTDADNQADAVRKGRRRGPKGEAHHLAKLTADQVRSIRRECSEGSERHLDIARRYGISRASVTAIASRKTWRHVV